MRKALGSDLFRDDEGFAVFAFDHGVGFLDEGALAGEAEFLRVELEFGAHVPWGFLEVDVPGGELFAEMTKGLCAGRFVGHELAEFAGSDVLANPVGNIAHVE